jgi:pyruvate,water dikinase
MVLWPGDIAPDMRAAAGGKGLSLGIAAIAGLPVPPFFVIPADVVAALAGPSSDWPATFRDAIGAAHDLLAPAGEPVAVRSSAPGEDAASASFAGQFVTLLDIRGREALFDAIAACRASADGAAAAAYRERRATDDAPAMAVVVQRMAPARRAGVAFTIDPVTGSPEHVIVESVDGRGDALVGGHTLGRRVLVPRSAANQAPGASLEARVAALALRCEALFGSPQDMEFAADDEQTWLLQSRPITVAGAVPAPGEFDAVARPGEVWTRANVGEILPGVVSPLTVTTFGRFATESYVEGYRKLRLLGRDEQPRFIAFFHHQAYLNVTAARLIADRALGASADAVDRRLLGSKGPSTIRREPFFRRWRFRLASIGPTLRLILFIHRYGARLVRETHALERRLRSDDPVALTGPELEERRLEIARCVVQGFHIHVTVTGLAGSGFETAAMLARPILGDETEGTLPLLFTGLRGVESAEIGVDLWDLSRVARAEGLALRLRDPSFDPRDTSLPDGWRRAFRAFIEKHGHRAVSELDAAVPCWRQDPSPVVRTLVQYLELPEDAAPARLLDRQAAEREETTRELLARMGPVRRLLMRVVLAYARRWVVLREATKSAVVQSSRLLDHYLPEVQRRMVAAGVIDSPEDIFFLSEGELGAFLRGELRESQRAAVLRRRVAYERDRHIRLPERFSGVPEPLPAAVHAKAGAVIEGTPVSPGIVTGRARVIIDPARDPALRPGEVLVAPVTDAGWTPLFSLALALVVDMGSPLSHGSTVAREFGLPAVVNVRDATTRIRTGDLVSVDGTRGIVTVLEDTAALDA